MLDDIEAGTDAFGDVDTALTVRRQHQEVIARHHVGQVGAAAVEFDADRMRILGLDVENIVEQRVAARSRILATGVVERGDDIISREGLAVVELDTPGGS